MSFDLPRVQLNHVQDFFDEVIEQWSVIVSRIVVRVGNIDDIGLTSQIRASDEKHTGKWSALRVFTHIPRCHHQWRMNLGPEIPARIVTGIENPAAE
jgi:hypothetical protein